MDWRTDAGNDNTRRPKLASGKNAYDSSHSTAYGMLEEALPAETSIAGTLNVVLFGYIIADIGLVG